MQLIISCDGSIRCLYSEELPLATLGRLIIERGSHVEPDELGNWHADMSPVAGPKLGPFTHRSEALDAERSWLEQNWL